MKYIIQLLIIIVFAFIGEVLHHFIPVPVPASIYGIILLFGVLEMKWIKVKDIREVSMFLIAVMPVMFIPSAVGLIDSRDAIKGSIFQYLAITIISTVVVMSVAGLVTQYVIRRGKEAAE